MHNALALPCCTQLLRSVYDAQAALHIQPHLATLLLIIMLQGLCWVAAQHGFSDQQSQKAELYFCMV